MSRIAEFSLGHYSDRHEHESAVTLNVYEQPKALGHRPRHILAYWLSKEHKEVIFERIQEFAAKRSITLKTTIYEA